MKVSHLKEIRSKCWEVIKTSLFIIIVSGFYACKKNINEDLAQEKVTNYKNTISAIIYQLAAGDNCNANAEDCEG
jgi:hypothetical protein